jgi:hypothetical protein
VLVEFIFFIRSEKEMSKATIDQLLQFICLREHEHRDSYDECVQHYNEQLEKCIDHIDDLERYIKKLEAQIVDKKGGVETTNKPCLDTSDMKPVRVVAYR